MLFYVCYTKSMAFRALVDLSLCLSRRFFLGGVSSLRGFYEKQAGPTEARIGSSSQVTTYMQILNTSTMRELTGNEVKFVIMPSLW